LSGLGGAHEVCTGFRVCPIFVAAPDNDEAQIAFLQDDVGHCFLNLWVVEHFDSKSRNPASHEAIHQRINFLDVFVRVLTTNPTILESLFGATEPGNKQRGTVALTKAESPDSI
jgi:hypothetical protein